MLSNFPRESLHLCVGGVIVAGLTLDYHVSRQNKTKETRVLVKNINYLYFRLKSPCTLYRIKYLTFFFIIVEETLFKMAEL